MAERQDADLALAAPSDVEAFAELYRRHVGSIYRYLLARTGTVDAAEDLTAQTFETALTKIRAFRGDGVFIGWLMAIARTAAQDYYRQQYRRERHEAPMDALDDLTDEGDAAPVDEAVTQQLEVAAVVAALEQIAPERAEVIRLRLFADLSIADSAKLLNKTEAAVKMLLQRALRDVRRRLALHDMSSDDMSHDDMSMSDMSPIDISRGMEKREDIIQRTPLRVVPTHPGKSPFPISRIDNKPSKENPT